MTLVDLYDFYVDPTGRIVRWQRGRPVPIEPGVPTLVAATVTGTTLTVTWADPVDNGGSAVTGFTTAMVSPAGASHSLGVVYADAFTVTAGLASYQVSVAAVNSAGSSTPVVVTVVGVTSSTAKFPGHTDSKVTGTWLFGINEADKDPSKITSPEASAPEAVAGVRAAGMRYYFKGTWASVLGVPSGQWADSINAQYAKGRFSFGSMNVSVPVTGDSWAGAIGAHNTVVDTFIAWAEETAPPVPIPIGFNHEPDFSPPGTGDGQTGADFGHFYRYVRSRMDVYANAHGGVGVYKWKRLSLGPILMAMDYAKATSKGPMAVAWPAAAQITASASSTTSLFTSNGHLLANGRRSKLTSPPGGFNNTTLYWVVNATTNTFQLALTRGGTPVTVTSSASGITVTNNDVWDWVGADPYIGSGPPHIVISSTWWTANFAATLAWTGDPLHPYPLAVTEWGIYMRDPDAGNRITSWCDKCMSGDYDIWFAAYFNSKNSTEQPQFYLDNISNDHMLDHYVAEMQKTRSVHLWDLGFPKPPGA